MYGTCVYMYGTWVYMYGTCVRMCGEFVYMYGAFVYMYGAFVYMYDTMCTCMAHVYCYLHVCTCSRLPWFDVFYLLLNKISELSNGEHGEQHVQQLLDAVYSCKIPGPNEPCIILEHTEMVSTRLGVSHVTKNVVL